MKDQGFRFSGGPKLDLSIIIVSFKVKEFLRVCLRSIIGLNKGIQYEIIVADNNSSDGTREMVESEFPTVRFIQNQENLGFAEANNRAVTGARGRYVLLLNPDTFVYEGTLSEMVSFMDQHPEAGAAGCRNWLDEDKTFQLNNLNYLHLRYIFLMSDSLLGRFFTSRQFLLTRYWEESWKIWNTEDCVEVKCIVGAFMILRRDLIEKVGLMDPGFYMFCEDNDLCERILKAGAKIYFNPGGEIVHYVSKSVDKEKALCGDYMVQSLIYYLKKHYGNAAYWLYRAGRITDRLIEKVLGFLSIPPERIFNGAAAGPVLRLTGSGDRIQWTPDERADAYLVEISQDRIFTQKVGVFTEDSSLTVPYDILVPGKHYFWRAIPFKDGRYLNWHAGGRILK
jgi:GT2 family glycosyltransferase